MADLTVTWKGAVSFDAFKGQHADGRNAGAVRFDAGAMAAGFDIRPLHDSSVESAFGDAIPYSSDDDFEWAAAYEESVAEVTVPKRGRPKKGA